MHKSQDVGAQIYIQHKGGIGYGATPALHPSGIELAAQNAMQWASIDASLFVTDFSKIKVPEASGSYRSDVTRGFGPENTHDLAQKVKLLDEQLRIGSPSSSSGQEVKVVDTSVSVDLWEIESFYFDVRGNEFSSVQSIVIPEAQLTVAKGSEVATRSFMRGSAARQGGIEVLEGMGFWDCAARLREEAFELLAAPNCPEGTMQLLLSPDQMILQIHESIGHPLELDRILGDERNFAGTSFVTPDMFGHYQYGSELLNITFDPTDRQQIASYGADDEGLVAKKEYLIKEGLLLKPLGGNLSYQRAEMYSDPVACSRSVNWNRPPIDRMANLNLEPGESSFDDLVSKVEKGVWMQTNNSWSIDDSRNKFQFGCERAVLIEDGKLKHVVKNPSYRGVSAKFWRNLAGVGDASTREVLGTPNCGKGEPNQVIHVGHASPVCLFNSVEVFGGVE